MNNLSKLTYYVIFFVGMFMCPFSGFSQQEEPKRVSVLVIANEIVSPMRIQQLPAKNLPVVISRKASKRSAKRVNPTPRASTFAEVSKTQDSQTNKERRTSSVNKTNVSANSESLSEVGGAKKTPNATRQSQTKVVSQVASLPKSKVVVKAPTVVAKESAKTTDVSVESNPTATTNSPTDNNENTVVENSRFSADQELLVQEVENKHSSQVNAASYIWIGAFLILAGLVLGLLFGKPAFLVSIAGVVFVVLGFLV